MKASVEFKSLYRDGYDRQVRRAALLVGSSEDANDIVQDVFVELYKRWDDIDRPGPYLHQSVLNGCRQHGRRTVKARELETKLRRPSDPVSSDAGLWDVLAKLPFNQRAVVVLRYYAGMTEREIAEHLGCKQGSVGPWLQRGLNKMGKALR